MIFLLLAQAQCLSGEEVVPPFALHVAQDSISIATPIMNVTHALPDHLLHLHLLRVHLALLVLIPQILHAHHALLERLTHLLVGCLLILVSLVLWVRITTILEPHHAQNAQLGHIPMGLDLLPVFLVTLVHIATCTVLSLAKAVLLAHFLRYLEV